MAISTFETLPGKYCLLTGAFSWMISYTRDRTRHVRVQRPRQPAALRQHLAAAGAAAAPADVDPPRRPDRDVAVGREDGRRLRVSLLLPLPGGPRDNARLLGRDGAAPQGPEPVPRRPAAT